MTWNTVEELTAEFQLICDPTDLESIERQLEAQRNALHPDHSGGAFPDEEIKAKYLRIEKALGFIRTMMPRALALHSHMAALSSAMERLAIYQARTSAADIARDETEREHKIMRSIRRRYLLPKITSAMVAATITAILTLIGGLKDNPIYTVVLMDLAQSDYQSHWTSSRDSLLTVIADIKQQYDINDMYSSIDRRATLEKSPQYLETASRLLRCLSSARVQLIPIDEQIARIRTMPIEIAPIIPNDSIGPLIDIIISQVRTMEDSLQGFRSIISSTIHKDFQWFYDTEAHKLSDMHDGIAQQLSVTARLLSAFVQLKQSIYKSRIVALEGARHVIVMFLIAALILAVLTFIFLWYGERVREHWVQFLLTEDGLEYILQVVHQRGRPAVMETKSGSALAFSGSDVRCAIERITTPDFSPFWLRIARNLSHNQASQVADLVIGRLCTCNAIEVIRTYGLRTLYRKIDIREDKAAM